MPANYTPKNETERALQESLRGLELQCKERVELLEALRESRKDAGTEETGPDLAAAQRGAVSGHGHAENELSRAVSAGGASSGSPGWIGEGTIPSLSYPDLSRPQSLSTRPAPQTRLSMESVTQGSKDRPGAGRRSSSNNNSPGKSSLQLQPSSSSPEKKKGLLTTLRSKDSKSSSWPDSKKKSASPGRVSRPPAASQAAGLAWGTVPQPTQAPTSGNNNESSGPANSRPRNSSDINRSYVHAANEDTPKVSRQLPPSTLLPPPPYHSLEQPSGDNPRKQHAAEQRGANLAADAAAAAAHKPGDANTSNDALDPSASLPRSSHGNKDPSNAQSQRPGPGAGSGPTPTSKAKPRAEYPTYRTEFPDSRPATAKQSAGPTRNVQPQKGAGTSDEGARRSRVAGKTQAASATAASRAGGNHARDNAAAPDDEDVNRNPATDGKSNAKAAQHQKNSDSLGSGATPPSSDHPSSEGDGSSSDTAEHRHSVRHVMKHLPKGIDATIARQILNEIVVRGDEVHWDDVAGLEAAKKALKEAVVYPFLRPDLFMGLREPARGMLLFGPPGTGKTMLARAVATESKSTFFSVSASTLTSKWHGESEKLVRALFALAKAIAPSIIFVDEIDSLLSSRSAAGEGEASRRSKTEFLIQWSDLQRAAAGREQSDKEKRDGDASRVLVLAATNMPWDIDEAARRRFVRRQYIPLPEDGVRKMQIQKLLSQQKHELTEEDIDALVKMTDGKFVPHPRCKFLTTYPLANLTSCLDFSGSDITALAKDAAMGPLRNLGEDLLHTPMDQICPIKYGDFEASLRSIRPSVSREGLKEYEEWAKDFGERGG